MDSVEEWHGGDHGGNGMTSKCSRSPLGEKAFSRSSFLCRHLQTNRVNRKLCSGLHRWTTIEEWGEMKPKQDQTYFERNCMEVTKEKKKTCITLHPYKKSQFPIFGCT
jgi:hypothetical protein